MAIDSSLKHNSAGVYTLIIDKSQQSNDMPVSPTRQRLLIGFSKQGPVNRPVQVNNYTDFVKMFGDIDRSLEKSGSYFHRMAKMALNTSSILVLNLLKTEESKDRVPNAGISVASDVANNNIMSLPLSGCYDTSVFWIPDAETYGYTVSKYFDPQEVKSQILNFVNINKKPVSILVKRSSEYNRMGYNMTVKDWYGDEEIPSYLNPTSIVSDYFVDVYIVQGDFGPKCDIKLEPTGTQFDDGTACYTEKSVPVEKDKQYYRFTSDITYQNYFDENGFKAGKLQDFLKIQSVKVLATYTGCLIPNFVNKLGINVWIQKLINDDTNYTGVICYENTELIENAEIKSGYDNQDIIDEKIDIIGHKLVQKLIDPESEIEDSEGIEVSMLSYSGKVSAYGESNGLYRKVKAYTNESLNPNEIYVDKDENIKAGDYFVSDVAVGRLTRVYNVEMVEASVEESSEAVFKKVICYDSLPFIDDENNVCVAKQVDEAVKSYQWICLNGFKLEARHMPGAGEQQEPFAVEKQQENILSILEENYDRDDVNKPEYSLFKSLVDKRILQFRYLVDTFGNGICPESKKVFTEICQKRLSLAIINGPSVKEFKSAEKPGPVFRGKNGIVSAEYISKGGNPNIPSQFKYSLPKEEQGAAFGGYFYPYVKILDNSIEKFVPPSAAVSNLFYKKGDFPWYLVAGTELGVLGDGVKGVESTITDDNRDWLEPFGYNSIVKIDNYEAVIYGNVTAKQSPKSSLSSLHCTDTLIYIVLSIENILQKYIFGVYHNDDNTRREIKSIVDSFLEDIKRAGGIYDFSTVMNKSNNTNEVIDANSGVIDVGLELAKGLEKITQRATIYKTGVISTLSFGE